ncbi:hypothetical protein MKZ38_008243 [Zalerion maritima]|uniref:C2H2-type domain-containing protein n=1 Tax=Zalerion maritima TaxID=339359 RepID=A0AAD5WTY3_9PEZI|nr:hypothetical protein MKZ38_008243 [Zalerion maritima]
MTSHRSDSLRSFRSEQSGMSLGRTLSSSSHRSASQTAQPECPIATTEIVEQELARLRYLEHFTVGGHKFPEKGLFCPFPRCHLLLLNLAETVLHMHVCPAFDNQFRCPNCADVHSIGEKGPNRPPLRRKTSFIEDGKRIFRRARRRFMKEQKEESEEPSESLPANTLPSKQSLGSISNGRRISPRASSIRMRSHPSRAYHSQTTNRDDKEMALTNGPSSLKPKGEDICLSSADMMSLSVPMSEQCPPSSAASKSPIPVDEVSSNPEPESKDKQAVPATEGMDTRRTLSPCHAVGRGLDASVQLQQESAAIQSPPTQTSSDFIPNSNCFGDGSLGSWDWDVGFMAEEDPCIWGCLTPLTDTLDLKTHRMQSTGGHTSSVQDSLLLLNLEISSHNEEGSRNLAGEVQGISGTVNLQDNTQSGDASHQPLPVPSAIRVGAPTTSFRNFPSEQYISQARPPNPRQVSSDSCKTLVGSTISSVWSLDTSTDADIEMKGGRAMVEAKDSIPEPSWDEDGHCSCPLETCDYASRRNGTLKENRRPKFRRHWSSQHEGKPLVSCPNCHRPFTRRDNMAKHLKSGGCGTGRRASFKRRHSPPRHIGDESRKKWRKGSITTPVESMFPNPI